MILGGQLFVPLYNREVFFAKASEWRENEFEKRNQGLLRTWASEKD